MSLNKMLFSLFETEVPLRKIIKPWPQLEEGSRLFCRSILDGYAFYSESLICHITLRELFLRAISLLSDSFIQLSDFTGFRESTTTSLRERAQICPYMHTKQSLYPLSDSHALST